MVKHGGGSILIYTRLPSAWAEAFIKVKERTESLKRPGVKHLVISLSAGNKNEFQLASH